ncbi:ATP-binding protein [Thiomicrorhabdus sediminis]|uniref:ATP-binding protein n=1 Tax=Thiomicrorhabdus sediminis TaxID=2580412 RepID=UPI001EE7AE99|nr:ATP-binding protein [Thiomicrorhabdus sediminis]
MQEQTVQNLALILENRTDLWALQIQSGVPTRLSHLNLKNSVLWVVNANRQTTYVVGQLPESEIYDDVDFFTDTGRVLIKTLATFLPYTLPYPYPQSATPEHNLITQALQGKTHQQYRMDQQGDPYSLMSSTPLIIKGRIIGAIVLEQRMETLFSNNLNYFYRLIGIGALIFFIVIIGALINTASLSNRIIRLDNDVKRTFNIQGRLTDLIFTDSRGKVYRDELSDLRHHIYEMLKQLGAYERYLKQLPKTLRHEIHNPLNRLSMALSLLEKQQNEPNAQLNYAQHALEQLKQIISSLSEATSIEDSLHSQTPEPFPIGIMLEHYLENTKALHENWSIEYNNQLDRKTMVCGDGFMIEQLLDKLLSNAADFTDNKHPVFVDCYQQDNQVVINVINSGPFLPKGHEKQIFDGMTSIRTLNQDTQAHLGLGLYIVKLIADFHQGQTSAENITHYQGRAIQGVKFSVQLPVFKA